MSRICAVSSLFGRISQARDGRGGPRGSGGRKTVGAAHPASRRGGLSRARRQGYPGVQAAVAARGEGEKTAAFERRGRGQDRRGRGVRSCTHAVIIVVDQRIRCVLRSLVLARCPTFGGVVGVSARSNGDLNNVLTMLSLDGRGSGEARFVAGRILRGTRKLLHRDNKDRRTGAEMRRFLGFRVRGAAGTE